MESCEGEWNYTSVNNLGTRGSSMHLGIIYDYSVGLINIISIIIKLSTIYTVVMLIFVCVANDKSTWRRCFCHKINRCREEYVSHQEENLPWIINYAIIHLLQWSDLSAVWHLFSKFHWERLLQNLIDDFAKLIL